MLFINLFVSNSVGFGGSIDLAAILDFVDSGHDLIVAADSNASDLIREIATESGIDFDEVGITVLVCKHFYRPV
jgi:oligosaccharyltransferase complex subunit beta